MNLSQSVTSAVVRSKLVILLLFIVCTLVAVVPLRCGALMKIRFCGIVTIVLSTTALLLTGPQTRVHDRKSLSYFSTITYVVGTQKNRLDEMVLLSTLNTCLN